MEQRESCGAYLERAETIPCEALPTRRLEAEMSTMANVENRSFNVAIVRHGERVDHVFGHSWYERAFDESGEYMRIDLNMPASLQGRRPQEHWAIDPPLTELGKWQARQVGEALAGAYNFGAIACSPSLGCHQTAVEIRHCLPNLPGLVIEPGLLEMGSWCSDKIQDAFKTRAKDPCTITEAPLPGEGVEDWFERSDRVFRAIMERHATCGKGDLLIVAHGLSHEVLTFGMLSQEGPVPPEIAKAQGYQAKAAALYDLRSTGNASSSDSYCGTAVLRYSGASELKEVDPPTTLSLSHRSNKCYNQAQGSNAPLSAAAGNTVPQGSKIQGSPQLTSRRHFQDALSPPTVHRQPSPSQPSRKSLESSPSWKVIVTPLQGQRDLLANGDCRHPPLLSGSTVPIRRRTSLMPVVNQQRAGDLLKGAPLRRTIPSGVGSKQLSGANTIVTPQWIKELAQQRSPKSPVVGARDVLLDEKEHRSSPVQQCRKAPERTPQMTVRASPPQVHRVALQATGQRSTAASLQLMSPRLSLGGNGVATVMSGLASPPAMKRPMSVRSSLPVQASVGVPMQTQSAVPAVAASLQSVPLHNQVGATALLPQGQAAVGTPVLQSKAAGLTAPQGYSQSAVAAPQPRPKSQPRKVSPHRLRSVNGWVDDAFVTF